MRRILWHSIQVFSFASLMLLSAGVSRADDIVYTLTGSVNPALGPVHEESFQFTSPGFITSSTSLSVSQLDSCVACDPFGTAVEFFPNGAVATIIPVDYIAFTDADGVVYGFFFAPGTFSAPGTYSTFEDSPYILSNIGTLTIEEVAAAEPSSVLLLALGLLSLVAAAVARRIATHSQPA